jgi:hypothetical protein
MDQALLEEIIRQARMKSGMDSFGIPPQTDYMAQVRKSPFSEQSNLPEQGTKISSKDPNQQRYPDIPAPVEDQKALEDMIAQQRGGAGIGAFEKGMTNATKSFLTTGAAIRLGANPVPDSMPTGLGEGVERGSALKNKMYEASQGRAMDTYQTKVKSQEAQKQRDLEQLIAQMQMGSREKIAELDSGNTSGRLALSQQQFAAAQDPQSVPNVLRQGQLDVSRTNSGVNAIGENRRQVSGLRAPPTYTTKAIPLLAARKKMEQLRESFDSGDIHPGVVTGRVQELRDMLGAETEDTAKVIATLMDSLSSFVLSKTGQQASAKEYAILASILPRLIDNPPAFKARLDNFIRILDLDLNNFRDVGAGQNFDMSPLGGKKVTQFPDVIGLSGMKNIPKPTQEVPAPQEGWKPSAASPDQPSPGAMKVRDLNTGTAKWLTPEAWEKVPQELKGSRFKIEQGGGF